MKETGIAIDCVHLWTKPRTIIVCNCYEIKIFECLRYFANEKLKQFVQFVD